MENYKWVFFPVNITNHWVLVVVQVQDRTIHVLDSILNSRRRKCLIRACRWVHIQQALVVWVRSWAPWAQGKRQNGNKLFLDISGILQDWFVWVLSRTKAIGHKMCTGSDPVPLGPIIVWDIYEIILPIFKVWKQYELKFLVQRSALSSNCLIHYTICAPELSFVGPCDGVTTPSGRLPQVYTRDSSYEWACSISLLRSWSSSNCTWIVALVVYQWPVGSFNSIMVNFLIGHYTYRMFSPAIPLLPLVS